MTNPAATDELTGPGFLGCVCDNWFPALPVVEVQAKAGRKPNRAKRPWCKSQEQRAFAAGMLHSISVYSSLHSDRHEICAMLLARGLINGGQQRRKGREDQPCLGARPGAEVCSFVAASDWLDGHASDRQSKPSYAGPQLLRLTDDSVGKNSNGRRVLHALEQLVAWVLLWADRNLELRWLGTAVGFGVFTTIDIPASVPIHLGGVADYEFLDRHAMIQVGPTWSDRDAGNCTHDTVTVYGPVALINASCAAHANVSLTDEDLGVGGRTVFAKRKAKEIKAHGQVLAAYLPPRKQKWECPFRSIVDSKCHKTLCCQ